jgi:putative nucleotidyltransferase with HDIG domain
MPDQQNRGPDGARFELGGKSILETNHPFFAKVKKELPVFQQRFVNRSVQEKLLLWAQEKNLGYLAVIVVCSFILSFFIYRQISDPFLDYRLGDTAQRHLIAPRTIEMTDDETTEAKRKTAVDSLLSVYDYDRRIPAQLKAKIAKAFNVLRRQHQGLFRLSERKSGLPADVEKTEAFQEAKRAFSEALDIEVTDGQFLAIAQSGYNPKIERVLVHLLAESNLNLIVSNRELLKADTAKGITLNRLDDDSDRRAEIAFHNTGAIIDVEAARQDLDSKSKAFFESSYNKGIASYQEKITGIARKLVSPNLTLNRQESERRRQSVSQEIKPVIVKINKGDTIVRFQDTINKRHLQILRQLENFSKNDATRFQFFFTTIFLTLFISSVLFFLKGGIARVQHSWKDLLGAGVLMISTILAIKGVQFLATEALIDRFPQVPFDFYYYLVPVAAGPVLVRMLMGKESALVFSVVLAIVGGILLERNFFYAAYILSSSLLAASLTTHIKTRSVVYRGGVLTGFFNVVLTACIMANTRNSASFSMLWEDLGWVAWAGMLSGFLMSMIVVSIVPLVEMITGRTSDLRLLELANMNHPLLRDLMVKAPGTYHHCIVIGSLVEAGAEAIGANPLLARVMAYYHDVGKMERPLYFIENQGGGYNRHDALQPHMSAMIIREHVKRGQELGRKFKLPQPIIDAMSEHHGSSTIIYFYNKARSQAEDPNAVLESDYKYDGQKPQSKETALVMLGDVVEAATRSVADPTPLRLSGVVKNVLNKYFAEGQLSDCDLTLRDLDAIAKSFLDVLIGIYHARIEYGVSSVGGSGKKRYGNSDQKGSSRARQGSQMVGGASPAPYTKPFPSQSSGGGGSKKG